MTRFFMTINSAPSTEKRTERGGLEGGVTNGMPVVALIFMKPISTLARPLQSVDIQTKEPFNCAKRAHRLLRRPGGGRRRRGNDGDRSGAGDAG